MIDNLDNSEKLRSCVAYTMQPRNSSVNECNTSCNQNATTGLKGLAELLLQRNRQRNSGATNGKNQRNFTTEKTDEKLRSDSTVLRRVISIQELQEFLGEDWSDYKDDSNALDFWVNLLFKNHLIDQGIVPDNFTAITWCNLCGYVYVPPELTNGGNVLGCPWCWNRVKKLPIPKPVSTH